MKLPIQAAPVLRNATSSAVTNGISESSLCCMACSVLSGLPKTLCEMACGGC